MRYSPLGVALALRDIDLFGGSTRGSSSWIVEYTPLRAQVEPALEKIARDDPRESRRAEALWLLWERTGDKSYLLSLYRAAANPGPPRVNLIRQYLAWVFPNDRQKLTTPASVPIGVDEATFETWLVELRVPPDIGGSADTDASD